MKKIALGFALALLPLVAHAWGGKGHQLVARVAVESLSKSPLQASLARNVDWLAVSSSHPDRFRNRPDGAEAGRHFLDGERFGFGADLSKIPQSYAEVVKLRDYAKLRTDGVNPWTVARIHGLLVLAFQEKRWPDAYVQMAYLSHYLGDAHVPFHATENYDGQLSEPSQKGIHARFEEKVLEKSINLSDLHPGAPLPGADPIGATFSALTESIGQVPAILAADRAAETLAGDHESDAYWAALVEKARPIAIGRLELGGRRLAGVIQSAWELGGKPTPPRNFTMDDRWLPYAAPFTPRGTPPAPAMPVVTDAEKAEARTRAKAVTLKSNALGKEISYTLLLPRDYDAHPMRKYPVLYLLHGAWGGYKDWNASSGIAAYVANLPLIVVMPDAGGDSFYQNSAAYGAWQTYFETELIPHVDSTYRTISKREGRALTGLSMGGYGSWRLGLNNPDKFCAAASLSGVVAWGEGPIPADGGLGGLITKLYGTDQTKWNGAQLWPTIAKLNDPKKGWRGPALYFDCGKDDFLIQGNQQFEQRLLENRIPYEFSEFPGAHTWPYWDEHVRDALNFVLRHLAPAT